MAQVRKGNVPSVDSVTIQPTRRESIKDEDYVEFKRLIDESGLQKSKSWKFYLRAGITFGAAVLVVGYLLFAPFNAWVRVLTDSPFFIFVSGQCALIAHDIAHGQAPEPGIRRTIARHLFFGVALGGIASWWTRKHNQHHATPNHIDKDPDVRFPFLVFSPEQMEERSPFLQFLVRGQQKLIVVYALFQAVNARKSGFLYLIRNTKRHSDWPIELTLFFGHLAGFGFLMYSLGFGPGLALGVITQGGIGLYNTSLFASNHKGMLMITKDNRLGFFREQVLTSRDLEGGILTDTWYGGLNWQAMHHLFPKMPRENLREATEKYLVPFCQARGVTYTRVRPLQAYKAGFAYLGKMSKKQAA